MLEVLSDDRVPEGRDLSIGFGRFVGSWSVEATWYGADGSQDHGSGDWVWSWILGGQAILDVLTFPARSSTPPSRGYAHNVLIRVFDESQDLWKVVWTHPPSGTLNTYTGRFSDDGGVVLRNTSDGEPTRWVFSEVTDDSFHWEGLTRDTPDGDWRMDQLMTGRRKA